MHGVRAAVLAARAASGRRARALVSKTPAPHELDAYRCSPNLCGEPPRAAPVLNMAPLPLVFIPRSARSGVRPRRGSFELWRLRLGFAALWACAARELKAVLSAGPIELSGRFLPHSYSHWAAPRVCRRRRVHLVRIHPPTRRYDTCKPRVKPKPPAKAVKESSETAVIAF